MEGKKCRGHVVLLPYPVQGHINPILQFAKRLAATGLKATLATTPYTVKAICAPTVTVETISDGFDEGGSVQAGNAELYVESFMLNGSRTLSQIIHKYRHSDSPVNCIVYDAFLPWALDVAEKHGIYGGCFFTNSLTVSSVLCAVHRGSVTLPIMPEDTPLLLPGLHPLNYNDLPTLVTRHLHTYPAYFSVIMSQFSNIHKAGCLLVNSFEGLEETEGGDTPRVLSGKLIGPMIPSAYLDGRIKGDKGYGSSLWKPPSEECMEWLETKEAESVAFVSFGSMGGMSEKQMEEIAAGLKESGLNFIWVVRDTEKAKLPDGFTESIKEKGLIVAWCNQLEVLDHEAVGCFVTHCGWNSTVEALSLGVAMVGVPQWTDQFCDAKFIEEVWKVGVWAKEDSEGTVKREEIVRCLKELVQGKRSQEIKQNAKKWRELAKQASSEGGTSDQSIQEFVHNFMGSYENGKA